MFLKTFFHCFLKIDEIPGFHSKIFCYYVTTASMGKMYMISLERSFLNTISFRYIFDIWSVNCSRVISETVYKFCFSNHSFNMAVKAHPIQCGSFEMFFRPNSQIHAQSLKMLLLFSPLLTLLLGRNPLRKPKHWWESNIRKNLWDIGCEDWNWVQQPHNRVQRWAEMMNFQFGWATDGTQHFSRLYVCLWI
jgi:hypothetical protein